MKFCSKCGNRLNDDAKFCNHCGAQTNDQPYQSNDYASTFTNFNNTADFTAECHPNDIEQNKVFAFFAYLSWLVLIPIFAAPKSKFARFHANQGIILAISEIIVWFIQIIVTVTLYSIYWKLVYIAIFLNIIFSIVNIVFLAFAIIGIINAVTGKARELPFIGKFRILKY